MAIFSIVLVLKGKKVDPGMKKRPYRSYLERIIKMMRPQKHFHVYKSVLSEIDVERIKNN
jgi:hypothetical protein